LLLSRRDIFSQPEKDWGGIPRRADTLQTIPQETLLVKSRPLNFQEYRRALLHTTATVSPTFRCRMQYPYNADFGRIFSRRHWFSLMGTFLPFEISTYAI
jgi:hypothetical protein